MERLKTPLNTRPGFKTSRFMARDVGELAKKHRLIGCVLVSFTREEVGVNSSGEGKFAEYMAQLAEQILAAIDDGRFDPVSDQSPSHYMTADKEQANG